jgi:hypothetical protein
MGHPKRTLKNGSGRLSHSRSGKPRPKNLKACITNAVETGSDLATSTAQLPGVDQA